MVNNAGESVFPASNDFVDFGQMSDEHQKLKEEAKNYLIISNVTRDDIDGIFHSPNMEKSRVRGLESNLKMKFSSKKYYFKL